MSTPSDFQRLASVIRTTFPAPIAAMFHRATEGQGAGALPGLLSTILRYLTLVHLRAYWSTDIQSPAVAERLTMFSGPAPDGRWLDVLRAIVAALGAFPPVQPDPVLLESLLREGGLESLEAAVSLRNRFVHDGDGEAPAALRNAIHRTLGLLVPLRFHRVVAPLELLSTSPVNTYRVALLQGYTRPYPTTRLRTELALSLGSVYLLRSECSRLLHLGPLFLASEESLLLFSHRAGKAVAYWDSATGRTLEKAEGRIELESLHKRLEKATGIIDARHVHLEGDSHVARRLAPGSEVSARYEIDSYLRSGGMADVYRARDREAGGMVAIKMLPLELTRDTSTLARFLREVDEVRKVNHPRVVRYRDHGEDAGDRYLVLECATGWEGCGRDGGAAIDLGDLPKPLPEDLIVNVAQDVAEGLQEIHSRGLIHRDLKPGNVLLFEDSQGRRSAKISDFGISFRAGATQYTLTGFFVGTPEYMAPEQTGLDAEMGPESDIYSLGIVLYECLTGDVPFRGNTPFSTLEQQRTRRPEWPLLRNPAISPGLANVVMKCLQKEGKRRYRSALQLMEDLKRHCQDPAGFQEIPVVAVGEDLGDLVLEEELRADQEGTVFRAMQSSTGKTLWVRTFSSVIADDAGRREKVLVRIKRLAEAQAPGLPLISGTGEVRGTPFVVLEPVPGEVPCFLPPAETAAAILDLARALSAIHARGIPHGRVGAECVRRNAGKTSFADYGWLGESSAAEEVRAMGAILQGLLEKDATRRRVPADLEAIGRKAVRTRDGYASITQLTEDLERFNSLRPLAHAEPAGAGRVVRLFLFRHSVGASVAALLLALASLVVLVPWMSRREPRYTLTPPVPLTSGPGLTLEPSLMRDGKLVAYASDRAGNNLDIWVQPIEGGEARRLTSHEADDREPDLSPDGEFITYRSERDGGGLYLVPASGGDERKLVELGRTPRISPDGGFLAYWIGSSTTMGARAYVLPLPGGPPREIAPDFLYALEPVWHPDGKHILVFGSGPARGATSGSLMDWWVIDVDGGGPVRTEIAEMFGGRESLAWDTRRTGSWTPEGNQLLFSIERKLWMVSLSRGRFKTSGQLHNLSGPVGSVMDPAVAVGGRIVFSTISSVYTLWSLEVDHGHNEMSSALQRLTDGPADVSPSVSNRGDLLVFNTYRSGDEEVWIKDLNAGSERPLNLPDVKGRRCVVTRDGKTVAYVLYDWTTIRVVSLEEGTVREFRECGMPYHWSFDGRKILFRSRGPGISVIDIESGEKRECVRHEEWQLYSGRFSPDDRRIAFNAVSGGRSRIFIAPAETTSGEEEWLAATDGAIWDDKPAWSPRGDLLYFMSDRDGFRCIWAQRLDPDTQRGTGAPFPVYHSHAARLSLRNANWGIQSLDLAEDRLVFCLGDMTGNIWLSHLKEER